MTETRAPAAPPDREARASGPGRTPWRRRNGRPAPRSTRRWWAAAAVAAVVWALWSVSSGRGALVNPGGWTLLGRFWRAAAQPDLSGPMLAGTARGVAVTVAFAALGTILSVAIGLVGGVLTSETWWRRPRARAGRDLRAGWLAGRAAWVVPRGVHEAVWGLFLVNVLGRDPLVGVLAIAIPYGAITAKVYAELIDETAQGPYEALRRAGAGRVAALIYGVIPRTAPDLVSYAFYRFECSIRSAVILGMIGAGGLGFQLSLSFQSLDYRALWTQIYALVAVCALADAWGSSLRAVPTPARRLRLSVAGGIVVVAASVGFLGPDLARLAAPETRELLAGLVSAAWPPALPPGGVGEVARLAVETVQMALLAVALASLPAVGIAFAAARGGNGAARRVVAAAARFGLLVTRAVPPPVWALLVLFVLFPGPLPGAVALAVYTFGVLGRLMAEVVENLDRRPAVALRALGAGESAIFGYALLPAAAGRFAAYSLYRWEVAVRDTVVVGVVGAGGLGRLLEQQRVAFDYAGMTATVIALVVASLLIDLLSARARRALR